MDDKAWNGFPPIPSMVAYHWVMLSGGTKHAAYWNGCEWNLGREYLRPCEAAASWKYISICITPDEVTAIVEGRNQAIRLMSETSRAYGWWTGMAPGIITALKDCADELEAEVNARYPEPIHPSRAGRMRRDLEPVIQARHVASAIAKNMYDKLGEE